MANVGRSLPRQNKDNASRQDRLVAEQIGRRETSADEGDESRNRDPLTQREQERCRKASSSLENIRVHGALRCDTQLQERENRAKTGCDRTVDQAASKSAPSCEQSCEVKTIQQTREGK